MDTNETVFGQMKATMAAPLDGSALATMAQQVISEALDPFTRPLADLAADKTVVERTFSGSPEIKARQAFGWDWSFQVTDNVQFSMDVLDDEEMAREKIAGIAGHHVVRYRAKGALSAQTQGGQDVGAWKFGVKAGAGVAATFDWFMSDKSTATLGTAALRAAQDFAAPFVLGRLLELVNQANFWGATVAVDGKLSASLSVAGSWTHVGWSWGAEGKAGGRQSIGISLGVEGTAAFALEGGYKLVLAPVQQADKTWRLKAAITRTVTKETHLGLTLSAGADFSALAASAERVARAHLPDPKPLEDRVKALLMPGTHFKDFIAAEITKAVHNQVGSPGTELEFAL